MFALFHQNTGIGPRAGGVRLRLGTGEQSQGSIAVAYFVSSNDCLLQCPRLLLSERIEFDVFKTEGFDSLAVGHRRPVCIFGARRS